MRGVIVTAVAAQLLLVVFGVPAMAGTTAQVSVSSAGDGGNWGSWSPSMSADGRYVAFRSEASNLVAGDTNGAYDIFVRDRLTGTTERVSVGSGGEQGNGYSNDPSISADGRYVAFVSSSVNLVPGDTNADWDIFVRDRVAGTTERVNVSSDGAQSGLSSVPSISADGRYVAFMSWASNLVPGDTNETKDVFVRDRLAGTTERVSVSTAGGQGGGDWPSISADGRYVAFVSASGLTVGDTNGEWDIFVRDRVAGTTERVSVSSAGEQGNDLSGQPSISADGRYVAFISDASNLVAGDTSGSRDVFVRDRLTGATERASLGSAGEQGSAETASISADGRYVAFESWAPNLVPGDTNGYSDIFVRDRLAGTTERVSLSSSGEQGNGGDRESYGVPAISADGRYVAFESSASNLVPGDSNGKDDVFVRDRVTQVFPDVSADYWAAREIAACFYSGIVQGYWDGYRPDQVVTRDQMAVYVSRALAGSDEGVQVPTGVEEPTFSDVADDYWAYRYVEYCAGNSLVQGYPGGTYHPDEAVNRGQMAVYIARALAGGDDAVPTGPAEPTFTDVTPSSDWAWCYDYVEYCAGAGIVQGYWDGYHPEREVTRDQMAVYVARAFALPL